MGREARRREATQAELEAQLARWAQRGLSALESGAPIPAPDDVPAAADALLRRLYPGKHMQVAIAMPMPADFMTRLDAEAARRGIKSSTVWLAAAMVGAS
jgi:hypothetical protein